MKELIIIGAGPAGLTAAIYGVRAGLDLLVVEKFSPGGQVLNTYELENYPGFAEPIPGWQLMADMEKQAKRLGVEIQSAEVIGLEKKDEFFLVHLGNKQILEAKSVIVAAGSANRSLDIPGEKEFLGQGVSYCATCDGAFYKDKEVAVIGGGNTALEEAYFLTKFASKIYLLHRRDQFRGDKILQDRVLASPKIKVLYNRIPKSILGEGKINKLIAENVQSGEQEELSVEGVFIFVGFNPNTSFIPKEVLTSKGEIVVNTQMETPLKGLLAAGDLRQDSRRQIVMAASDGANAAMSAYEYLLN